MSIGTSSQSPTILGQWGIGHLVPSLIAANAATYTQVGNVITVTSTAHGIPLLSHNGKKVYLSPSSGLAPIGWYSDLKVLSANTFQCFSDISQTTSGNITTLTATEIKVPLTLQIPANAMGKNGQVAINEEFSYFNSANAKTRAIKFNNIVIITNARTTSSHDSMTNRFRNRNNSDVLNTIFSLSESASSSGSAITLTSFDTGSDITVSYHLTCAAVSEYISLDSFQAVLYPSS